MSELFCRIDRMFKNSIEGGGEAQVQGVVQQLNQMLDIVGHAQQCVEICKIYSKDATSP